MTTLPKDRLLSQELWTKGLAAQAQKATIFEEIIAAGYKLPKGSADRVAFNVIPQSRSHEWWLTNDGRFLEIAKMETDHIQRCIGRIFRSKTGWRADYMPHLIAELERRSKAA